MSSSATLRNHSTKFSLLLTSLARVPNRDCESFRLSPLLQRSQSAKCGKGESFSQSASMRNPIMRSISSLLSPSEEHPSVAAPMKLIVLTYVYNDWPSYETLMPLIDVEFDRAKLEADMLLVDDGSTETPPQ